MTVLALFLTHMSNFPMFLGCPKVTFSYAFMYLTHWPSHTLLPCVQRACAHVIHMKPSYFIQVRWFLRRVRATAITRYRDNDAVCVRIVHVCVLFISRTQFCIMRFRWMADASVVYVSEDACFSTVTYFVNTLFRDKNDVCVMKGNLYIRFSTEPFVFNTRLCVIYSACVVLSGVCV